MPPFGTGPFGSGPFGDGLEDRSQVYDIPSIDSEESFGVSTVLVSKVGIELASGIASAEAFEDPHVCVSKVRVEPDGFPSAEAFGTPQISALRATMVDAFGTGPFGSRPFGSMDVFAYLPDTGGIPSAESFGTARVSQVLREVGAIASAEAFGAALVSTKMAVSGAGAIASAEAFGSASLAVDRPFDRGRHVTASYIRSRKQDECCV